MTVIMIYYGVPVSKLTDVINELAPDPTCLPLLLDQA